MTDGEEPPIGWSVNGKPVSARELHRQRRHWVGMSTRVYLYIRCPLPSCRYLKWDRWVTARNIPYWLWRVQCWLLMGSGRLRMALGEPCPQCEFEEEPR